MPAMKTQTLIDYFGGPQNAADCLGITRQGLYFWKGTVPVNWQIRANLVSEGEIRLPAATAAEIRRLQSNTRKVRAGKKLAMR